MDYSQEQFDIRYKEIYGSLVKDKVKKKNHAVIFLGGQPGTGKSAFYTQDNNLNGYIVIDGDSYRKYHPEYENIIRYDFENYVGRTQPFVNQCIERLIADLSDEGYNLVIEGTLRDPDVPVHTCSVLKGKGYKTDLYIIGADARTSWESTINRARILESIGEVPRLVPIDKFNSIVNALPDNAAQIGRAGVFDSINIIDRDNKVLYSSKDLQVKPLDVAMKEILNLEEWNMQYEKTAESFLEIKISFLNNEVTRRRHGR